MRAVTSVFNEQFKYFRMMTRLGWFELKTKYAGNNLGILWIFLNPMLQIGVYWFAFGVGLKSGQPVNGVPYVYWLTIGLIAWFYINQSISTGTNSIYSRIPILSKMNFPISIVPTFTVFAQLLEHGVLLLATAVVLQIGGYGVNLFTLQLPYYVFATTCLLIALNLLLSAMATVVRDIKILVSSALKFGMFLSPILWTPDHLPKMIQDILHLNPLFYLLEGYRASFLGQGTWFYEQTGYTLYFWGLVIILFVLGAVANKRLQRNLLDYV